MKNLILFSIPALIWGSTWLAIKFQLGVVDRYHRGYRIDGRHLDLTFSVFLHYDVAGEHRPDLVLGEECLVGQGRIARPEDQVVVKVNFELFFQCLADIDFRQDTEPFLLESGPDKLDGLGEGGSDNAAEEVGHGMMIAFLCLQSHLQSPVFQAEEKTDGTRGLSLL